MRAELRAEVFRALAAAPLLSSKLFVPTDDDVDGTMHADASYVRFLSRCLRSPHYKVRVASAGLLQHCAGVHFRTPGQTSDGGA